QQGFRILEKHDITRSRIPTQVCDHIKECVPVFTEVAGEAQGPGQSIHQVFTGVDVGKVHHCKTIAPMSSSFFRDSSSSCERRTQRTNCRSSRSVCAETGEVIEST